MSSDRSLTVFPSGRVRSYIRPVDGGADPPGQDGHSRTTDQSWCRPQGQGCYRPDAVSARPMGHRSRRSLSISLEDSQIGDSFHRSITRVAANQPPPSRPPTSSSGPRRRPSHESGWRGHAASGRAGLGSNATSRVQTAQTIRPSLLATAIVALLWPRRACTINAH